jgi:spermidine synthase
MISHDVSDVNTALQIRAPVSGRFLPILLVLFTGSGCAALIYEIIWFQLLQLVIGSSGVSLGVLLGTYMGGMCLGSLALPRIVSPRRHPLRIYGLIELGIGAFGLAVLFGMPVIARLYAPLAGHGFAGILLRGAVSGVCLLPPTMLMGATLPAIARWVEATPKGVSWLGFFYAGNTAGAVFGCLLAGFYLLRVHDMPTGTYFAVVINGTIGLVALGLAALTPHKAPEAQPLEVRLLPEPGSWTVYAAIALSGMSALGAEVIWTRLLSLMMGATAYAFSIILAVFLAGLWLGSSVGSYLARSYPRPRVALGSTQLLLSAAIAWTAYIVSKSLPFWPINPSLSPSPWYNFQLDIVRSLWAILPPALLWGASFPLALAAASRGKDTGRMVGGIYAANTLGAIAGSLGFSMVFVPSVGSQQSQRILIGLAVAAGLLAFSPLLGWLRRRDRIAVESRPSELGAAGTIGLAVSVFVAAVLVFSLARVPWELIAYGRYLPTQTEQGTVLYAGEGMNASVAVTELSGGTRNFHISGRVEASSDPADMRMERMLGHLPALVHQDPRRVLVVGCGAGVTAGSLVPYPGVERIVICEIEPLIPKVVARYFSQENYGVLDDRRTEVVYDDARHYILTTKEKFDIITSDPIHPWLKGSAALYTKEYYELCKRHLNRGGVMVQWVPLYESTPSTVKSEIATFFKVFPNGTVWSNDINGMGYDVVVLGQVEPTRIDLDALQSRLGRSDYQGVAQSIAEVGMAGVLGVLGTYAGQESDLLPWLRDGEINLDRNLRLQYLAGMGLNSHENVGILDDILSYRKFPDEIFTGSDGMKYALRRIVEGNK